MKIGVPARGDLGVLLFDVRARSGRAVGPVAVSVRVPRSVRSHVGVLAVADTQGARRRFAIYIVSRRSGRASGAQEPQRITVTVRGVQRTINVSNIERATDALEELTDDMAERICESDTETVRKILGLRGAGAILLAKAIRAVLCDTADDQDVELLVNLGLIVPDDDDEFDCDPFQGNPFEATCLFTGPITEVLRVRASEGLIFSQCFAGTNPCMIESPGAPNNAVLYGFPGGTNSTGPLNMRSSNQMYPSWGMLTVERSVDGGMTFQVVERFDPP